MKLLYHVTMFFVTTVVAIAALAVITTQLFASDNPPDRYIPGCTAGRAVFWSSEGTAWDKPAAELWITVFNPSGGPQQAKLTIYPDQAADSPLGLSTTIEIPRKSRRAVHVNQWLRDNGLGGNRNVATEVSCSGVCAAALATWTGNYSHVAYNPLTFVCELDPFISPY